MVAVMLPSALDARVDGVRYSSPRSEFFRFPAAGEVKIVGLLLLSAMLLGEGKEFTLKMTLGCVAF